MLQPEPSLTEPPMLPELVSACLLAALTVTVHALGLSLLLKALLHLHTQRTFAGLGSIMWLLIRVTWWLLLIHAVEITVWALFYWWQGCMPNAEAAFYFAGVTYTTVGYGDLVLSQEWRLLGPVEGLTGILMCGLSTGFFFAVLKRIVERRMQAGL